VTTELIFIYFIKIYIDISEREIRQNMTFVEIAPKYGDPSLNQISVSIGSWFRSDLGLDRISVSIESRSRSDLGLDRISV